MGIRFIDLTDDQKMMIKQLLEEIKSAFEKTQQ